MKEQIFADLLLDYLRQGESFGFYKLDKNTIDKYVLE